jgi:hypothetical protein
MIGNSYTDLLIILTCNNKKLKNYHECKDLEVGSHDQFQHSICTLNMNKEKLK